MNATVTVASSEGGGHPTAPWTRQGPAEVYAGAATMGEGGQRADPAAVELKQTLRRRGGGERDEPKKRREEKEKNMMGGSQSMVVSVRRKNRYTLCSFGCG